MSMLMRLDKITKIYGNGAGRVEALKEISFAVRRGEYLGIMGPSGSGKSTLLSVLGAMNPPSSGRLEVDGIDVYKLSIERQADFRREYLGFIFQNLQLVPYLTALENVMLPLVVTDVADHETPARRMLEKVGLRGKAGRLPSELSGGEQGRVAIARAIVNNPPILLADEPTGSLDSNTGGEIVEIFEQLHADGQTIIVVTHNPNAAAGAERIINIKDGRIAADNIKTTDEVPSTN